MCSVHQPHVWYWHRVTFLSYDPLLLCCHLVRQWRTQDFLDANRRTYYLPNFIWKLCENAVKWIKGVAQPLPPPNQSITKWRRSETISMCFGVNEFVHREQGQKWKFLGGSCHWMWVPLWNDPWTHLFYCVVLSFRFHLCENCRFSSHL